MSEPQRNPSDESIVKKGGIGTDADAEDVSRDTYGFAESGATTDTMTPEDARHRLEEILPEDALEGGSAESGNPGGSRED